MKELHNHIFSNTTCISKEIMLKHINNQLSVRELHEVEKHLVDCEFCSEAMEGLKYAENSSILFAIDNQIDQRVRTGGAKSPVMRNLMVAASVLILIMGTYFTVDYYNGTIEGQANLAVNDNAEEESAVGSLKEAKPMKEVTKSETKVAEDGFSNDLSVVAAGNNEQSELNDDRVQYPEVLEESPMEDAEVMMDEVDMMVEDEVEADEEEVYNYYREPVVVQENSLKKEAKAEESVDKISTNANNAAGGAIESLDAKAVERKKNDDSRNRSNKDKQKSKNNKKRSMSPGYKNQDRVEDQSNSPSTPMTTVTLSNFKVVDYTQEYQDAYDLKNKVESNSVPAGFATEQEKLVAEKEQEELEVAITYKETLDKAMAYFKAEKYVLALDQFTIILKEHPEEVNGQFYGGLSYFELNQYETSLKRFDQVVSNDRTEFNEEARWYKALSLIELSRTQEAKKELNKIVTLNGFYAQKAKDKLKELEK